MVLAVVVSKLQSTVPVPVQALVSRSQSLLATRVHSAFADTAVFTAAGLILGVAALWIVAAVLCKRKRPPPPAAYAHNRYERDNDAGAASEYDVCIVGAGVVGASLATVLARQGVRVACVERDLTEPDRIVGELLQPSGVEKLKALGLYEAVCGIDAQSVPGYGIIMQRCGAAKQEHIKLPYPNRPNGGADNRDSRTGAAYADEQMTSTYTGRGLHNGRFLMNLRRMARAEKNVTLIQGNVNKLLQRADGVVTGVVYRPTVAGAANSNPYPHLKAKALASGNGSGYGADHKEAAASAADGAAAAADGGAASQRVRAALTIVVDGCFSVFRQPIWDKKSTTRSKFLGLVLDNCELTVPGCGNVILADPSPVLVYPISSTETRMLIDFPTDQLPEDDDALIRHLTTKVRPQLPESVQRSFDPAVAGRRWQWMPNQSLCVERPNVPVGAMVLGDSFNMRHPLTGGGMTVGFTDVELVARLFKPISAAQPDGATRWRDTQYVHGRVTAFYEQRLGRSAVINILADALYQVFLFKNTDLCEACYDYLGKGPLCYEGPVSLLSGLSRSQALLVAHFYSVALFAVGRLCLRLRFVAAVNMFRTACRIILPLLVQENNTAPVRALWFVARWAFWL